MNTDININERELEGSSRVEEYRASLGATGDLPRASSFYDEWRLDSVPILSYLLTVPAISPKCCSTSGVTSPLMAMKEKQTLI
ncbi:hypothetical protein J6590_058898 [Homalodisca vitripennis]|nr:hypothetical protein J6590_058898 [Homalodisca vitripennis]